MDSFKIAQGSLTVGSVLVNVNTVVQIPSVGFRMLPWFFRSRYEEIHPQATPYVTGVINNPYYLRTYYLKPPDPVAFQPDGNTLIDIEIIVTSKYGGGTYSRNRITLSQSSKHSVISIDYKHQMIPEDIHPVFYSKNRHLMIYKGSAKVVKESPPFPKTSRYPGEFIITQEGISSESKVTKEDLIW